MQLTPCHSCHRHIHATAASCPFCGHALHTTRAPSLLGVAMAGAMALIALSGCGDKSEAEDDDAGSTTAVEGSGSGDSESDSSGTTTDTGGSDTAMTGTDTDASSTDTDSGGGSFYAGPEMDFGGAAICDPFAQDCPEGEKCVPYSSDGGSSWNANKCVPVLGDGLPGDECSSDGIVVATDSCGAESICWDVIDIMGVPTGTCTEFCGGQADEPICPAGAACLIANGGTINLCIDICDPLLQECDDGEGCYWTGSDFQCIFTTEDIPTNEPCGFTNDCIPGNVCVDASVLPSCDDSACCASWCDISDPSCPVPDTECVPWFDGDAPPGYENLGACLLPP